MAGWVGAGCRALVVVLVTPPDEQVAIDGLISGYGRMLEYYRSTPSSKRMSRSIKTARRVAALAQKAGIGACAPDVHSSRH